MKDKVDKRNCWRRLLLWRSMLHFPLLAEYHIAVVLTCVTIILILVFCLFLKELPDPGDISGSGGPGDWLRPGQGSGGAASQRPWQEALTSGLSLLDGPRDAQRGAIWPQGNKVLFIPYTLLFLLHIVLFSWKQKDLSSHNLLQTLKTWELELYYYTKCTSIVILNKMHIQHCFQIVM